MMRGRRMFSACAALAALLGTIPLAGQEDAGAPKQSATQTERRTKEVPKAAPEKEEPAPRVVAPKDQKWLESQGYTAADPEAARLNGALPQDIAAVLYVNRKTKSQRNRWALTTGDGHTAFLPWPGTSWTKPERLDFLDDDILILSNEHGTKYLGLRRTLTQHAEAGIQFFVSGERLHAPKRGAKEISSVRDLRVLEHILSSVPQAERDRILPQARNILERGIAKDAFGPGNPDRDVPKPADFTIEASLAPERRFTMTFDGQDGVELFPRPSYSQAQAR